MPLFSTAWADIYPAGSPSRALVNPQPQQEKKKEKTLTPKP